LFAGAGPSSGVRRWQTLNVSEHAGSRILIVLQEQEIRDGKIVQLIGYCRMLTEAFQRAAEDYQ
jgi:hypothetical protein